MGSRQDIAHCDEYIVKARQPMSGRSSATLRSMLVFVGVAVAVIMMAVAALEMVRLPDPQQLVERGKSSDTGLR
jgi:hypothetical protein